MKKILFFAITLVASALTFTACENNGNDPANVTPAMLAGTTWRVDSSYVEGKLDFMPHLVIDVLNKLFSMVWTRLIIGLKVTNFLLDEKMEKEAL